MDIASEGISVIVCTYNRPDLLTECINALVAQQLNHHLFEIIIVNNYPRQKLSIGKNLPSTITLSVLEVHEPGLSHARNKGIEAARFSWVAYIDDDALAHKDWLLRAKSIIDHHQFYCFGGTYVSWWKYGQPRWLPTNYGDKPHLTDRLEPINQGYNWGSNIFFRKENLMLIGGFPKHLGMNGTQIGYAEETYVQKLFRQKNWTIGYDPELIVYHLVGEHKLTISWHLKAIFADARDQIYSFPEQYNLGAYAKVFFRIWIALPISILKYCTKANYYSENIIIDTFSPILRFAGMLAAKTR